VRTDDNERALWRSLLIKGAYPEIVGGLFTGRAVDCSGRLIPLTAAEHCVLRERLYYFLGPSWTEADERPHDRPIAA
jgi:hypothetical protein